MQVDLSDDDGATYRVELVIQAGTAPSELKPGGPVTASFLKRAFLDFEGEQVWAASSPAGAESPRAHPGGCRR